MSTPDKKDKVGLGIRNLLHNINTDLVNTAGALKAEVVEKTTAVNRVPLDQIDINPKQPRYDFDEQQLKELAASVKQYDIIQPLTVSRMANGRYRLISGERRFRASKMAGLKDVPVYVRQANDSELLELALLENLQRVDLNPIEVALSYQRLTDELGYSREAVAERMGKDLSSIANHLRLLKLPPDIQEAVRKGKISGAHARSIAGLDTVEKQLMVFAEVMRKELSVRETDELIRTRYASKPVTKKTKSGGLLPAFKKIEDNLASSFGTRVKLVHSPKGSGSVTFEYYSLEEFNGLLEKLNAHVNS
jgi:ParB family chromosome partitioning protein